MIRHMSYVACDVCGDRAQPADDAEEARALARGEYFVRIGGQSLCPRHRPDRPSCPAHPGVAPSPGGACGSAPLRTR